MRRAYSYIRFSTPDQIKGDSFRRQTEFSNNYIEKHGLVLDDSLHLRDLGISAFRGANVKEGSLAGFLAAVKAGKVPKGSVLIVESLDRLSRDQIRPALQLFLSILDSGVSIVTIKPEREYTPNYQDPLVLIEPLIYFSRAHEESQTKSGRIADSWDYRRREAQSGNVPMTTVCPLWVELDEKTNKYALVPDRAKVVKRIFSLSREGMGTYFIAKTLNSEGVPPFDRFRKDGAPSARKVIKAWNTAYVRLILCDRRALGEYQPKRLVDGKMVPHGPALPDYYPAVVTEAEFYASLGTIKQRKKRTGRGGASHENIMSGLVYNAEDGHKMYYETMGGHSYLASTAAYYGKKPIKGRSFRYEPLEGAVLQVLRELKPTDFDEATELCNVGDRVATVSGKLAEVNNKLKRVTEKARTVAGDFDVYLDLIASLKADEKSLSWELEALKAKEANGETESQDEYRSVIWMRQNTKDEKRDRLNRLLRGKMQALVKEIWVLVVPKSRRCKVAHIQAFMANGEVRYNRVVHPRPKFDEYPHDGAYEEADLREYHKTRSADSD